MKRWKVTLRLGTGPRDVFVEARDIPEGIEEAKRALGDEGALAEVISIAAVDKARDESLRLMATRCRAAAISAMAEVLAQQIGTPPGMDPQTFIVRIKSALEQSIGVKYKDVLIEVRPEILNFRRLGEVQAAAQDDSEEGGE